MKFEHPLARSAKVWQFHPLEGGSRATLVVVTTLELDPEAKRFKSDLVGQLQEAARTFLAEHPRKATGFLLMNKPQR